MWKADNTRRTWSCMYCTGSNTLTEHVTGQTWPESPHNKSHTLSKTL